MISPRAEQQQLATCAGLAQAVAAVNSLWTRTIDHDAAWHGKQLQSVEGESPDTRAGLNRLRLLYSKAEQ